MAKAKTEYELIARGIKGREVIFYDIKTADKKIRCTPDQFAFLVGRKQIKNVSGQMYSGKVMFSGVGCKLTELPIIKLNESTEITENQDIIDEKIDTQSQQIQFDRVKTPDVIITKDKSKTEVDIAEPNVFDEIADNIDSIIEEDAYMRNLAGICDDEIAILPVNEALNETISFGLVKDIAELINKEA